MAVFSHCSTQNYRTYTRGHFSLETVADELYRLEADANKLDLIFAYFDTGVKQSQSAGLEGCRSYNQASPAHVVLQWQAIPGPLAFKLPLDVLIMALSNRCSNCTKYIKMWSVLRSGSLIYGGREVKFFWTFCKNDLKLTPRAAGI